MGKFHSQVLYKASNHQAHSDDSVRASRRVRQDKGGHSSARRASTQLARNTNRVRAVQPSKTSTPKHAVKITLWVRPLVKDHLERRAKRDGISLSSAGATFLERALQQSLDMQYGALLRPIIKHAVRDELKVMSSRMTWLLVRNAFDSGQTRALVANVLGRQPGITPDLLNTILDQSAKTAKGNLARKTPQLTALLEEVEKLVFHQMLPINEEDVD
jgi:hypothetical protein